MLVFDLFCDVCGSDTLYSDLTQSSKDFSSIKLQGHKLHVCNSCKKKYSRSGLYRALTRKYPILKRSKK